jgi:hypothetical protein
VVRIPRVNPVRRPMNVPLGRDFRWVWCTTPMMWVEIVAWESYTYVRQIPSTLKQKPGSRVRGSPIFDRSEETSFKLGLEQNRGFGTNLVPLPEFGQHSARSQGLPSEFITIYRLVPSNYTTMVIFRAFAVCHKTFDFDCFDVHNLRRMTSKDTRFLQPLAKMYPLQGKYSHPHPVRSHHLQHHSTSYVCELWT